MKFIVYKFEFSFLFILFIVKLSVSFLSLIHFSLTSLSRASFLSLSLSSSLPLSVSASEIDILLGSLTVSEDSTTFLCFFFLGYHSFLYNLVPYWSTTFYTFYDSKILYYIFNIVVCPLYSLVYFQVVLYYILTSIIYYSDINNNNHYGKKKRLSYLGYLLFKIEDQQELKVGRNLKNPK